MQNKVKSMDYANLLFAVCEETKKEEVILKQLELISQKEEGEAYKILVLPTIGKKLKFQLLDELKKTELDYELINFFKILVKRDDFELVKEIFKEYKKLFIKGENIQEITAIIPKKLSSKNEEMLISKLEKKLNKKVEISFKEDPTIIGGIKLKWDNNEIDNTIKKHLRDFASQI